MTPDVEKARELLKMLAFLQENERDLYVREASVLVYGDSKHFEEERYEAVCGIIREALGKPAAEAEAYDEILQLYHISNVEQEISVKGDFLIEMEGYSLETRSGESEIPPHRYPQNARNSSRDYPHKSF